MNTHKTFPYAMPVEWHRPETLKLHSSSLRDWLLNTGSLTERLQALTASFGVELLGQKVTNMDKSEAQFLSSGKNSLTEQWQIREVLLKGTKKVAHEDYYEGASQSKKKEVQTQQDWVFARSVLPNELCNSTWSNLGNQPLGKRIFNDENFVRSDFEIGKLRYHPISGEVFDGSQDFWARRSKFTIDHYELIVAEAFLPDSPCYWS